MNGLEAEEGWEAHCRTAADTSRLDVGLTACIEGFDEGSISCQQLWGVLVLPFRRLAHHKSNHAARLTQTAGLGERGMANGRLYGVWAMSFLCTIGCQSRIGTPAKLRPLKVRELVMMTLDEELPAVWPTFQEFGAFEKLIMDWAQPTFSSTNIDIEFARFA